MTACSCPETRPLTLTVAAIAKSVYQGHRGHKGTKAAQGGVVYVLAVVRVLNAAQMREADRRAIDDIGISSLVLMENAGRQAVAAMEAVYSDLAERQVAVLCGRGNNGGDGFVIARTLLQRGVSVSVFLIGRVAEVRGDARVNLEILGRLGLTVVEVADSQA